VGIGHLLRRGLAAGAAAGLAAAVVLYLVVEPVIRRALVIEEARAAAEESGHAGHAHGHGGHGEAEAELVSRGQQVVGGMLTAVVIGCLFGLVFAVVFARVRHRLPAATDHGRAWLLAGLGFFAFVLVPGVVVPSNPPAVGDPETVNQRTLLYVLAILVAVALVLGAFTLDRALASRGLLASRRTAIVAAGFLVACALALWALPGTPDAIPGDVPPALIWDFRMASFAQLGTMWAVLGVMFGLLVAPRTERDGRRSLVEPVETA